jgi:hypothetical protein
MTPPSPGENIVTLDPAEAMRAATISAYKPEDWSRNIEGAGAEMAFAKWAGVYYGPPQTIDDGIDVAGCQVKSTGFAGGALIIPQKARLDAPCVLVTGELPEYVIRGWFWPEQADEKWLRSGKVGVPSFWIPQEALYPLADLKAWIRERAAA